MAHSDAYDAPMEPAQSTLPECGILIQSRTARRDKSLAHSHKYPSLIYIVSGSGFCDYGRRRYVLGPNQAILLRQNTEHQLSDKPKQAMTVFSLYFRQNTPRLGRDMTEYLFGLSEPLALVPYFARASRRLLRQMLNEQNQKPPGYGVAMTELLSMVLLNLYRAHIELSLRPGLHGSADSVSRVRKVLEYVSRAYFEHISLSEASEMANLSQRQFSNICNQLAGKSFIQFLNQIRTDKAAELLEHTEMPVAAIAFEVGYEEVSTFYRAFKKHQGRTPH